MSSWMGRCPGQGLHTGASKWQSTPPSVHTRSQTERGCKTVTCTHVIRRHSPSLLGHKNTCRAALVSTRWPAPGPSRERRVGGPQPADSEERPSQLDHHQPHPRNGFWGSAPHANIPPARLYLSPPQGSHEGLKTQGGWKKERRRRGKKTKLNRKIPESRKSLAPGASRSYLDTSHHPSALTRSSPAQLQAAETRET